MTPMNYQSIAPENVHDVKSSVKSNRTADCASSKMKSTSEKSTKHSRNFTVDVLVIFFGISSWVHINGLWVELPQMVQDLPEHFSLASYIVVASQLANIGPLLFSFARRFYSQKTLEVPVIHTALAVGVVSCALLAAFWDRTTLIGGKSHSTALLILAFCLAFMDCMSSVVYLPFMANFKEIYVIPYLIGEGMSGLLPSLLALAQGVGHQECRNISIANNSNDANSSSYKNINSGLFKMEKINKPPRFSISIFFAILTFMVALSWIAFLLLNISNLAKSERVYPRSATLSSNPAVESNFMISSSQEKSSSSASSPSVEIILKDAHFMTSLKFGILLAVQLYLSLLHNIILSVQTYSCMAYGNIAYHMAVVLSGMANPAFCFLAMFFIVKYLGFILGLVAFASGWAAYILTTAVLSPNPPLVDEVFGSILVVISWILAVGVMAFIKASIASILRRAGSPSSLYWYGVVTQIGSAIGAFVTFGLVKYTDVFKEYEPCQ